MLLNVIESILTQRVELTRPLKIHYVNTNIFLPLLFNDTHIAKTSDSQSYCCIFNPLKGVSLFNVLLALRQKQTNVLACAPGHEQVLFRYLHYKRSLQTLSWNSRSTQNLYCKCFLTETQQSLRSSTWRQWLEKNCLLMGRNLEQTQESRWTDLCFDWLGLKQSFPNPTFGLYRCKHLQHIVRMTEHATCSLLSVLVFYTSFHYWDILSFSYEH